MLLLAWGLAWPAPARAQDGSEALLVTPAGVLVQGQPSSAPLGRFTRLLDEARGAPLSLAQAREQLAAGAFQASRAEVPNLGNAAPPRWLYLRVRNPGPAPLAYRLYAAEGWVDKVDVWLLSPGQPEQHFAGGDDRSPARHLRVGLGFAFDVQLPPGASEVFLRADSVDAAALSLRLLPLDRTAALEGDTQHWIGLVHGFLLALVATYGLLWLALRDRNHLRYVAYVGAYLYMHLAYSGIGPQLLWPESPRIARYAILVGMTLFASAGLGFGRSFLDLAAFAPRLDRAVAWLVRGALGAMAACALLDWQLPAVHLAFVYIALFTFAMVGLAGFSLLRQRAQAGIFLGATLLSMVGTLVTTLSVMGQLPFNVLTFRAVECGVMLEAAIWALALGLRMRRQREDGARALELAQRDPLTSLHNRRGFLDLATPVFHSAARNARPVAAVVLDIDHFKRINDRHGHGGGDRTLVEVATRIRQVCRAGDIVARWGGEEFVLLLPETDLARARDFAERMRQELSRTPIPLDDSAPLHITASFGVAVRLEGMTLEQLLQSADAALYRAKDAGRDRVETSASAPVLAGPA